MIDIPQNADQAAQLLEALHQKQLSEQHQQNKLLAQTNVELATLYNWSKPDKALTLLQEATRLDPDNLTAHNQLGTLIIRFGKKQEAIAAFELGLQISDKMDNRYTKSNRYSKSNILNNLGLVYTDLGEVKKAISYYEQALAISRDIGDRQSEGSVIGNLGLAYYSFGDVKKAIDYYNQALAIASEIGDRQNELASLSNLNIAHDKLREIKKSHQLKSSRYSKGNILNNLGF